MSGTGFVWAVSASCFGAVTLEGFAFYLSRHPVVLVGHIDGVLLSCFVLQSLMFAADRH